MFENDNDLEVLENSFTDFLNYQTKKREECQDKDMEFWNNKIQDFYAGPFLEKIDENDSDNYRKVNILKWTHDKESIKIDEHGDIHCDAWGNYYIKGKDTIVETIELMNRYINECKKDKALRNFSFIELVTK